MRDFQRPGRSAVYAGNGMCATSHPLAAQEAVRILQAGGNAVDAAIAGAVLLGVCEPHMTGIGGDCFALVARPGEPIAAVNGSGRAPASADAQAMRDAGHEVMPLNAPHAVTVPGAIDGFCTLSDRWGKLGLDASLAPAIRYFDEGVPVAPRVANDWAGLTGALQGAAREHFLSGGHAPSVGDRFRLPGQAEVLRRVAAKGRAAFYEGEVAEDMISALAAAGHTGEDFAASKTSLGEPISGQYAGATLSEHPPNGQGATALLLLNILSHFDLASLDPFGAERVHLEAEATKLAYDARNRFMADPDHTARLDHMLSMETAKRLAALIEPDRALPSPTEASEAVHRDTVYITVVDRDRMAVSLIYSIFHGFGSGLASEKFGILFQNRGAGFSLVPGHPNEYGPRKRPMHTIIPGHLAEPDGATVPFGVMGGQYQSAGHARFVTNLRDFGLDLQTALDAPRSFVEAGQLQLERGYDPALARTLAEKGHDVAEAPSAIGGAQAIRIRPDGVLEGASDPRKDGCAIGH
ncbi:gamma-glutamyltransferase [Roseivivax halodurans JCM 10272]|uniref:Gamma-glutamyltransferase n=1 Tax=Roseivivax halodurans JCM 10272 TaxID=1449350 RepID=X7EGA6_9RHOB|nr:gamma-glutamyltransferase family protein [Roseivivax halodurans]ETX15134.1 gamma-glutamyltransferase [Roseivivax halodurans JCM 10272]